MTIKGFHILCEHMIDHPRSHVTIHVPWYDKDQNERIEICMLYDIFLLLFISLTNKYIF